MKIINYSVVFSLFLFIFMSTVSCRKDIEKIICNEKSKYWNVYRNGAPSNTIYYFDKQGKWMICEPDPFTGVRNVCSDVLYECRWKLEDDTLLYLGGDKYSIIESQSNVMVIRNTYRKDTLHVVVGIPYEHELKGGAGFDNGHLIDNNNYKFWYDSESHFYYFDVTGRYLEFRKGNGEKYSVYYGLYDNRPRKWRMESNNLIRISDDLFKIEIISNTIAKFNECIDNDMLPETKTIYAASDSIIPTEIRHKW